jgi:hypothetical protein
LKKVDLASKPLVVLIAKGGLGNQLHCTMAGFTLAQSVGGTLSVLSPRIKKNELRTREVGLEAFNFGERTENYFKLYKPRGLSLISWLKWKLLFKFFARRRNSFVIRTTEEIEVFLKNPAKRVSSIFLSGHFENATFPLVATKLGMPEEVELANPGKDYLKLKAILLSRTNSEIFGIHVRLGDFRTWSDGKYLLDREYFESKVDIFKTESPEAEFWIFSDEPEKALEMMPNDLNAKVISRDYQLTNAEELKLISLTDGVIASHGTFSWWGCYWNKNQKRVFYPEPGICLPGWTDISNHQH